MEIIGLLIFAALVIIIIQLKSIMENQNDTNAQFRELIGEFNNATNAVAGRLDQLITRLAEGGMSETQETENLRQMRTLVDRLKGLGQDTTNPVPAEDATPTENGAGDTGNESGTDAE